MAGTPADAIHFASKQISVGASEKALSTVIDAYEFTLTWISQNTVPFILVIGFLAFWVYQRRLGRSDVTKMQIEFEKVRDKNKSPPLPLAPPNGDKD